MITADHRHMGRNNNYLQLVGSVKLRRLSFRCTSHAGKFFVQTKVILQGDGREGLVFLLNLHTLFCFDGLVQPISPATAFHQSSGEIVNDYYFAVLYNMLMIKFVERVCFQGLLNAM